MEVIYHLEKDLPVSVIEWTPSSFVEAFHWHHSLEIGYCISGTGWFYFGEKKYRVRPGDVFVVNNMERHIAQADIEDPSQYLFVFFNKELIESEPELLLPFFYSPRKFQNQLSSELPVAKEIGEMIQNLRQEILERKTAYKSMARSYMMQICALLLRHFEQQMPAHEYNHVFSMFYKLGPVLSYIQDNFREPLELSDISAQLNLSSSRTRHLFKEMMGEGFKEYLLQLRVNEARRLLASTDLSIMDICLQSGFQSHNPFYHAFHKIVGMCPKRYREEALTLEKKK